MFLLGEEASYDLQRNDLEAAEAAYRRVLDYLLPLEDQALEPKISVVYHQLGIPLPFPSETHRSRTQQLRTCPWIGQRPHEPSQAEEIRDGGNVAGGVLDALGSDDRPRRQA